MFSFLMPSFASRTTPQLKSFYRGLAMTEIRTVYLVSLRRLLEQIPTLAVLHNFGDFSHRRLGHCGTRVLDSLRNNKTIHSSVFRTIVTYRLAKSQRLPFSLVEYCSNTPLQIIHSDVCETPHDYIKYFRYYVLLVDDFSRFTWLYPMKRK